MKRREVLVTGSLAFDYIMDFPDKLAPNLTPSEQGRISMSFLIDDLSKERGGTAGNISYNLGLLRQPVSMLATAGKDFEGEKSFYKKAGVDTRNVHILEDKMTASAFVVTDKADSQIIFFHSGAMAKAANYPIKSVVKKPDYVMISANEVSALELFADECRELGYPFMADIGMQLPRLDDAQIRRIIAGSDILIGNESEMALLKKKTGFSDKDLLDQAKIVITTLGPEGSVITTKGWRFEVAAGKPKKVVDPTGAGDAYRAGFLTGYLNDLDPKTCGQMGSVASCYAVEKYGTTNHTFSLDEFKERYQKNYSEELNLETQ